MKRKRKVPVSWQLRVLRLAERDMSPPEIAHRVGLVKRLEGDQAFRVAFADVVHRGKAASRLGLSMRLCREGIEKRRATALLLLAQGWKDRLAGPPGEDDTAATAARVRALIAQAVARHE